MNYKKITLLIFLSLWILLALGYIFPYPMVLVSITIVFIFLLAYQVVSILKDTVSAQDHPDPLPKDFEIQSD
jgi:uncharacterized protein YhhL (DUF1145 family)